MLTPDTALEALLFASGEPMQKSRITKLLELQSDSLTSTINELTKKLRGRGITLVETETELELRTSSEASTLITKLRENELSRDLGKAGLEVLAIILYRNGATRSEVDWVRGVNSSATIRSLSLRGLIKGTEDSLNRRRVRYHATIDALSKLGISRTEDLPRYEELARELKETEYETSIPNTT